VELNRCGEPIGKQDQYAAAFGGLNLIEFREDDSVQVSPITCARETVRTLESNVICFYTGLVRSASAILKNQQSDVVKSTQKQKTQKRMVGLAYAMRKALQQGQVDGVGELLHENWMLKKSLSAEISSDQIDAWYRRAREDGALGGKILGAGSGGFLMFYAPKSHHDRIERGLRPLRKVGMAFEPLGSRIIFVHE
jgi:D-glycero-alpha-D-manno-heptose-7-phosphate kinase